ncbi:uncharacterized protein [Onthophagus taurus]|uniref:uncharacterized protein n=1 Tax=Onthophagus taurus TaxID=166361 RepID=UPI0039BDD1E6
MAATVKKIRSCHPVESEIQNSPRNGTTEAVISFPYTTVFTNIQYNETSLCIPTNQHNLSDISQDLQISNTIKFRHCDKQSPDSLGKVRPSTRNEFHDNDVILPFWNFGIGVVRFANNVCDSADGLYGTCYTKRQCAEVNGGIISGSCASGIGVCCVVLLGCGSISSSNNTYFVNEGYPAAYSGAGCCTYTIQRCSPDICQVRIDFLSLTLAQPDGTGRCIYDALTITGGTSNIPIICGENSGQHVYVNFNDDQDIRIVIDTSADVDLARSWNIKVTQLACDCGTLAPPGCLMYYTNISGTVNSFNYGTTANGALVGDVLGTRELANLNYGICIDPKPGYCCITWSQSGGDPYSFTLTGDTMALGNTLPTGSVVGTDCTTDFVVIPNPQEVAADRFCGNAFPTLTSCAKPFVLTVVTNADEMGDVANRGFSLTYTQKRCACAGNCYPV